MAAPYKHAEMPPVVRRTADAEYVLEGQSGLQVATFDQTEMSHPSGWWSALIDAMAAGYDNPADAIHDLTLLMMRSDWKYVDDRGN